MHDCPVHEGSVRVVEVERKPITVSVAQKYAIDGSVITFEARQCDNMGCDNRIYCIPVSIKDGTKLRISEIIGDIECPKGENLTLVKLG
jgi:hypothetical protein